MRPTTSDESQGGEAGTWVLDLEVAIDVLAPDGRGHGRAAFGEWLWEAYGEDGLEGVCEGAVDVEAAAVAGLIDSPRVLDAAAAPADRDWVAAMPAGRWRCWFTDEAAARRAAAAVPAATGCLVLGLHRLGADEVGPSWREAFAAIDVPGFGSVRPAWDDGEATATAAGCTIFIDPGAGFGTGLHETTQLCLAAIAAWRRLGGRLDRVLDVGAGSGILGIAAAVLGGGLVEAVEIDPRVHDAIRGNAVRNGVADRLVVGAAWPGERPAYDLVVANIVAAVLVDHVEPLTRAVRRDADGGLAGCLVLSGLLGDDAAHVAAAFAARLGRPPVETARGDWRCLTFAPPGMTRGEPACR